MFIGPKLNTVFASRWKALMWAAGVMLTAYCSIPSANETRQSASDGGQNAAEQAAIRQALGDAAGGANSGDAASEKSPWAPDTATGGK